MGLQGGAGCRVTRIGSGLGCWWVLGMLEVSGRDACGGGSGRLTPAVLVVWVRVRGVRWRGSPPAAG